MTGYTFPLRAQDLRDMDVGAVIDVSDGVVGRLVSVTHGPLGTALILEGVDPVVYVFAGDLIHVDSATWERLRCDGDRRIDTQSAIEQQRKEIAIAREVDKRIARLLSPGWNEVGSPDWTLDE